MNAIATASSEAEALTKASEKLNKTADSLDPVVKHLDEEAKTQSDEADDANHKHLLFELAEVGLQIGIVLASVSIIARRRWLLGAGGLAGSAGVAILAVGFLS